MDLRDIDQRADALAEKMLEASQVGDIPARLEGLAHLAQIKAFRDRRHEWNEQAGWRAHDVSMREREIAVMESAADSAQRATTPATVITSSPRCGAQGTDGHDSLTCTKGSPHGGSHYDEKMQTYFQASLPAAEPTKPAADRLHELVSYLTNQSERELIRSQDEQKPEYKQVKHLEASKAYDDAATKLQEILQEGGI